MLSVNGASWLVICVFLLWMCGFHLVTCYKMRHISGREMVTSLMCSKYTLHVFFLCLNVCHARTWTCHWAIHRMEQNQHYACSQLNNIFCSSNLLEQFITSISCHFIFGQHRLNHNNRTYLCRSVPFFMLPAMCSSFIVCPPVFIWITLHHILAHPLRSLTCSVQFHMLQEL